MRIAVLVTSSFTTEVVKYEYFPIASPNRPWLKWTPSKIQFPFHEKTWVKPKQCVTSDGAVVSYLKYATEGASWIFVEPIFPRELNASSAKKFDIIFCPMVDILEYATIAPRHEQLRFNRLVKELPNLYPSYNVQKLINDKGLYYDYFTRRNIPMIDTLVIRKKDVKDPSGLRQWIQKIRRRARQKKWTRIVVKPTSGQEGLRFSALPEFVDDDRLANAIEDILESYDGVMVQEYIPGFDKRTVEHRLYTIQQKYAYMILTQNDREHPQWIREEGGQFDSEYAARAKKLAAKVCKLMPKSRIHGIELDNLLQRSDIGYRTDKSKAGTLFLSEQEFVPSLYARECPPGVFPEKLVGDGILHIARQYMQKRLARDGVK